MSPNNTAQNAPKEQTKAKVIEKNASQSQQYSSSANGLMLRSSSNNDFVSSTVSMSLLCFLIYFILRRLRSLAPRIEGYQSSFFFLSCFIISRCSKGVSVSYPWKRHA